MNRRQAGENPAGPRISANLQPKQKELLKLVESSSHSIIMYGGSAGGAKSHGLRDVSMVLSKKMPKLRILIMRRVSKELLTNHINPFFERYPELRKHFNKTERIIYYPNGSITKFGAADNEEDIYSYQGDEYDIVFIDEATHFTQRMIEFLMTRNRTSRKGFRAKTVMTMNPGGVGHAYIKRIGIDRHFVENEVPEDHVYLPARIYDNAIWSQNALEEKGLKAKDYYSWTDKERMEFCYKHSEYARKLMKLPSYLRRAYLEGDWNLHEGQFFPMLRNDIHVIKPFEIPADWRIMAGMDYGNVSCAEVVAIDHDLNMYVIHEWTEINKTTTEKARSYRNFLEKTGLSDIKTIADTNMFAVYNELDEKKAPDDVFKEHGISLAPVMKQSPDNRRFRIWCNDYIKDALKWEKDANNLYVEKPKLYLFEGRTPKLLETLPMLETDKQLPEDIDRDTNIDHHYDALKYCLITIKKPEDPQYRIKLKKFYERRGRTVV